MENRSVVRARIALVAPGLASGKSRRAESRTTERSGAVAHRIAIVERAISEYNERIEKLAQHSYPQVALLKQIKLGLL